MTAPPRGLDLLRYASSDGGWISRPSAIRGTILTGALGHWYPIPGYPPRVQGLTHCWRPISIAKRKQVEENPGPRKTHPRPRGCRAHQTAAGPPRWRQPNLHQPHHRATWIPKAPSAPRIPRGPPSGTGPERARRRRRRQVARDLERRTGPRGQEARARSNHSIRRQEWVEQPPARQHGPTETFRRNGTHRGQ